jgi:hypothetical protein
MVRSLCKIVTEKHEGKRQLGKPTFTGEDNTEIELVEI